MSSKSPATSMDWPIHAKKTRSMSLAEQAQNIPTLKKTTAPTLPILHKDMLSWTFSRTMGYAYPTLIPSKIHQSTRHKQWSRMPMTRQHCSFLTGSSRLRLLDLFPHNTCTGKGTIRSEERRVGSECKSQWKRNS